MQAFGLRSDSFSGHNPTATVVARPLTHNEQPAISRLALRAATDEIHQRMHQHPGLARLAAGTIGRDEYCRLLARSYGFYVVVEPIAGLSGRLTESLVRDLADLGLTAAAVSGLPRCMSLKISDGHPEMIGARYVLLGASLGGKVMAKAVARQNGGTALPTQFLNGSGDNDWKGFVAQLEAALPDVASRSRAAVAANATFAAYEEWMSCNE